MALLGRMSRDANGQVIQSANGVVTYGYVPAVAQVGAITGAATNAANNITVNLNGKEIVWPITPTVAAVAQVCKIEGNSDGTGRDAVLRINSTDIPWVIAPFVSPVAKQQILFGVSDGTETALAVTVDDEEVETVIDAQVDAVAQVVTVTGMSDGTEQLVLLEINNEQIGWDIEAATPTDEVQKITFSGVPSSGEWDIAWNGNSTGVGEDVSIAYDDTAAAIQSILRDQIVGMEAVTVTGNYTDGFTITFVGGGTNVPQLTVDTVTGSLDKTATVSTLVQGGIVDMTDAYEDLVALVNAAPIPVTASYIDAGTHKNGVKLTADVAGTAFTYVLDDETGTIALTQTVANVVEVPPAMAAAYEDLLEKINAIEDVAVTATYTTPGDHADGLTITANHAGTNFVCTISGETGTIGTSVTELNVEANYQEKTKYETLLAAVNGEGIGVTAAYINSGDHSKGITITADVAGTGFTFSILEAPGTIHIYQSVANVSAVTFSMATEYEELLGLINAAQSLVTATYVSSGNHASGITLTAAHPGRAFTCTLSGATGTVAYNGSVANKGPFETKIQSPQAVTTGTRVVAPKGAIGVILRGDKVFSVDTVTGASASQGLIVVADTYIQLPISELDSIYLFAAESTSISYAFLILKE